MKFRTLDGKTVSLDLRKASVCKSFRNTSKGQQRLGRHLRAIYIDSVFEDFIIPKSNGLSLDFYIPKQKMAFEFNGEQHYTFNQFFHNSVDDFKAQKQRDERKSKWCQINGIILVEVVDNKIYRKELKALILKAIRKQNNS